MSARSAKVDPEFFRHFCDVLEDECGKLQISLKWFLGIEAFYLLCQDQNIKTVLDVGAGHGLHSHLFRKFGKQVTSLDFKQNALSGSIPVIKDLVFVEADFLEYKSQVPFDLIWACHVLEHQPNTSLFFKKLLEVAGEDGIVCVTVPPLKHQIVGGHLNLWNMGLLLYHFAFNGFDLRAANWGSYDYNLSACVRGRRKEKLEFHYDRGDVELIAPFMPVPVKEGFDGRLADLGWIENGQVRLKLREMTRHHITPDQALFNENKRLRSQLNRAEIEIEELRRLVRHQENPGAL